MNMHLNDLIAALQTIPGNPRVCIIVNVQLGLSNYSDSVIFDCDDDGEAISNNISLILPVTNVEFDDDTIWIE